MATQNTQNEQALAAQLFGGQQQKIGAIEAAWEGVKEFTNGMYPGLKNLIPEAKDQLLHMGAMGAHELAAALFNGNGFVMYPRGTKDDHMQAPGQDQQQPAQQQGVDPPTQQQERGGRTM
jgi:hypothetical protein